MAGTKAGGVAAGKTNKQRYGEEFYENIGAIGGAKSRTGGFYGRREAARKAGAIGGTISRRGDTKAKKPEHESTCTFCSKHGHSALHCAVRANVKRRKDIVLAKKRVEQEERQETMQHLNKLNDKYGVKRPW